MSELLIDGGGFYSDLGVLIRTAGELMRIADEVKRLRTDTPPKLCVTLDGVLEEIALEIDKLRARARI